MGNKEKSVMILASHPDDAEIGMGGTMASLTAAGISVTLIDLTNGEPTPFGSPEKRKSESALASSILQISTRETLSLSNREIFDTVENRKIIAEAIRRHRPEILFLPYWEDGHPDHVNAATLGVAARFYAKLSNIDISGEPFYPRKMLHYFCTHIRPKVIPSFVFDISANFDRKIQAVMAYKSQFIDNPGNIGFIDTIKTECAYWGSQIGTSYGEPFISREQIAIKDPGVILEV